MAARPRVLVIFNPASGQGDPADVRQQIIDALERAELSFELRETEGEGDALKWARDTPDIDLLLVSGGDGTVMEAMSGLIKRGEKIPLAQLPRGTANLLARAIGVPVDIEGAIDLALQGEVVEFDVGYLPDHDRYFALIAGAGWDANLIDDATRDIKDRLGFLAYILTGIKNLFRLKRARVTLRLDGDERRFRAHTVMLLNVGEMMGTGIKVGEDISPHDGRFNLAIVAPSTFLDILRLTYRLIIGDFQNYRDLQYFRARSVQVESKPPLKVQIDGEILGTTPFRAEVVPEGVALVVPQAYVAQYVEPAQAKYETSH